MNWKKIFTIAALTGFSASVATGQGTAPTIIQGDYISNVFGQSNFIKNPNAKLNTKDVTVSNATVSRSISTPLVATSEFTVAIGTANGTATWATRAFDAGMKGQNCEARFTYRGFAATSKVHIKQGANTVASLNLTPATDPRIASINFPCGDLSTATTFVVTDTAILAGTNEIGAIYTGLATNMANVAQAETVVIANVNAQITVPTLTYTNVVYQSESLDTYGEYNNSTGVFTAKRAGNYFIAASMFWLNSTWNATNIYLNVFKNGSLIVENIRQIPSGATYYVQESSVSIPLSVGDTLYVSAYHSDTANRFIASNSAFSRLSISRFPTSSELVVTPERQNTFGSVTWTNAGTLFQSVSNNTYTAGNSTIFGNANATVYGPTATATGNTSEIKISNMPVGAFRIMYNGSLFANSSGSATNAECSVRIRETSTSVTMAQNTWSGIASQTTDANLTNIEGVFRNTSVGDRTFRVEVAMIAPTTGIVAQRCGYLGATNTTVASGGNGVGQPTIIVQPLDQPSNSALYVQGPVLAAATGAAIPAGYVGERYENVSAPAVAANNTGVTAGQITLPAGVWLIQVAGAVINSAGTITAGVFVGIPTTNSALNPSDVTQGWGENELGAYVQSYTLSTVNTVRTSGNGSVIVNITTPTTYYHRVAWATTGGGTVGLRGYIRAVRIN